MTNFNPILPKISQLRLKPRKDLSRINTKNIQVRMILTLKRAFKQMLTRKSKMEAKKI